MLVALEEKLRDPQVTYIYIFFILWVPWTCTPNLMGTDARVAEALESRAKWRTNEFTSIEPHRHGERYIRVIQLKKKKKQWRKRLQIISLHICGEESSNIYKTHCWIWQISKGELDEFFWKLIRWGVNDECGQREKNTKDRRSSPWHCLLLSGCPRVCAETWWDPSDGLLPTTPGVNRYESNRVLFKWCMNNNKLNKQLLVK